MISKNQPIRHKNYTKWNEDKKFKDFSYEKPRL